MREKLKIARQLRLSRKRFSQREYKKLAWKCYGAYVTQCIFKGRDDFVILFTGKYLRSFRARMEDWAIYTIDCLRRFYLKHFVPAKKLTGQDWLCIHHPLPRPYGLKVVDIPDEFILKLILKRSGLKIVDEHMDHLLIFYSVSRA